MGIIAANSEYVMAAKALVTPARRMEMTIAETGAYMTRVAADRRADRGKDAGADNGPDAEGGELDRAERAPQTTTGRIRQRCTGRRFSAQTAGS